MAKIKQALQASEAMFATTELLYKAADSFDEAIGMLKDIDYPLSLHLQVLQSQAKRFAGKVKHLRQDFIEEVSENVEE